MLDTKTVILAQVFISFLMALLMSGFMGFLHLGPTLVWLVEWRNAFFIAWPVAFLLSLGVGPVSFKLAATVMGRLRRS